MLKEQPEIVTAIINERAQVIVRFTLNSSEGVCFAGSASYHRMDQPTSARYRHLASDTQLPGTHQKYCIRTRIVARLLRIKK